MPTQHHFAAIHEPVPSFSHKKCQFCQNEATVVIRDLEKKPVFWMCREHILFFIQGLLEDLEVTRETEAILKLIKEQQEHQKAERKALHV